MISPTIKVVDTIPALQTAAAYLAIRQAPPSITAPAIPTGPPPLPPRPSSVNPSGQTRPDDGLINHKASSSNASEVYSIYLSTFFFPLLIRTQVIQSVLLYILLAVVLSIVVFILFRRFLRVHNVFSSNLSHSNISGNYSSVLRRYHSYFGSRRPVEVQPLHYAGLPHPPCPDPHLPGLPASAYMGRARRRTHATDIDPSGRRLGDPTVETDHDGELGIKDVLPAYDNLGRPPKYLELEISTPGDQPLVNRTVHRPEVGLENTHHRNDSSPDHDIGIHTSVASSHTVGQPVQ